MQKVTSNSQNKKAGVCMNWVKPGVCMNWVEQKNSQAAQRPTVSLTLENLAESLG